MKDTVVLDIETLGSLNNSVILSVGMVAVDSSEDYEFADLIKDGYYAKLDVKSQVDAGRKIHQDTLDWWKEQGKEAQRILKPRPDDMHWTLLKDDMIRWLNEQGVNHEKARFYARGSHFDFGLLQDLFRITQGLGPDDLPWKFWNLHDSKTVVLTLLGHDVKVEPDGFIYHDCLHDAAREYMKIQTALYIFQDKLGE